MLAALVAAAFIGYNGQPYAGLELVNELAIGLKGGNEDAAALVQSIEFVPPSESVSLRDEIKPAPSKARIIPPDHSRRQ